MPIIMDTDRRTGKGKLIVAGIYLALALGGSAMVYPFLVMVTGSVSNGFDYDRRAPLPRYAWSREDRFLHMLCGYFPPAHRGSLRQLRSFFPDLPEDWRTWSQIGDDRAGGDAWAARQLARLGDPESRRTLETAARDYAEFASTWSLEETVLAYDSRWVPVFLRERYGTLARFNRAWGMSIDDLAKVSATEWAGEPIDQASYAPERDVRYTDLLAFREAYRQNRYTRFLRGDRAPASYLRPATLRYVWEDWCAARSEGLSADDLSALPFPVPDGAPEGLLARWCEYLSSGFPLRHIAVPAEGRQAAFEAFLSERFGRVDDMNAVLGGGGQEWSPVARWADVRVTATVPEGPLARVWMDFVRQCVPVGEWQVRETLPDLAFQRFALAKYGSLEALNAAYGLELTQAEQLELPFGAALLVTFANRQVPFVADNLLGNYSAAGDYLVHRGRAVTNTIVLVVLSLLVSLTVNPLAAYALSRFRLRLTEKIIVFCLATMAFPAAVAAIPGFLLLRDLGLLNTFAALVLPSAANGMTIFLLKGFLDALPQELYEAATLDGAPEGVVFFRISLPLIKPILAVGALSAFLAAYNGWEWAIVVAQDPRIWTIAVWTYQFSQNMGGTPYLVMASFVLNSLPVLVVFLLCQRVILRGIILPQLK